MNKNLSPGIANILDTEKFMYLPIRGVIEMSLLSATFKF